MAEYFVRNGGNDGADGLSDATAWATIGKVNGATLGAGDIVNFRRNSVFLDATLARTLTGSIGDPLIFRAYGSATAFYTLTTWTNIGGAVWRKKWLYLPSTVPDDGVPLTQVDSLAEMSTSTYYYDWHDRHLYIQSYDDGDPNGHVVGVNALHPPIIGGREIGGSISGPWEAAAPNWRVSYGLGAPVEVCVDEFIYLTAAASVGAMTVGTYFHDSVGGFLYVRLAGDDDPDGHVVEVHLHHRGVNPTACSHFTMEDIELRAAALDGWLADSGNITGLTLRRVIGRACKQYGLYVVFAATEGAANTNITVEDCEGHYCGADGMTVGGYYQDVTLLRPRTSFNCHRSEIDFTAGFRSGGEDWSTGLVIIDPWSWGNGTIGTPPSDGGYGIWYDAIATGCKLLGGRIWENRFFGLNIERVKGTSLANGCQVVGVLTWRNGSAAEGGGGITIRTASDYCLLAHCVSWDNAANGLHFSAAAEPLVGVVARNNIAVRGPSNPSAHVITTFGGAATGVTLDHNCFGAQATAFGRWESNLSVDTYAELETEYGGEMNNLEVDPQLTDPLNGDFRLRASSKARDRGVDVSLPFHGTAPDIGLELPPTAAVLGATGIGF